MTPTTAGDYLLMTHDDDTDEPCDMTLMTYKPCILLATCDQPSLLMTRMTLVATKYD
jgi:hypothetical protein